LSPELVDGDFVFCPFEDARYGDHADLEPIASISEPEGLTLVIPKSMADDRRLPYEGVFKGIVLRVHSSLEAVGLTAAIVNTLAEQGTSANVFAGTYHDHIFVPSAQAGQAMQALQKLARS
jgi:hypothetical protein